MSLIACDECKEMISSKASSCPKCGAPVKKDLFFLLPLVIIALWVFAYADNYDAANVNCNYDSESEFDEIQQIGEQLENKCNQLKIESQEKIDFANFIYGILLVTVIVLRLFFTIGVLSGEAKSKE